MGAGSASWMEGRGVTTLGVLMPWLVFVVVLAVVTKPLGGYLARVFTGEPTLFDRPLGAAEALLFRALGIQPGDDMTARQYSRAVLVTALAWMALAFLVLLLQASLPFNPERLPGVSPLLAFNISASFVTNTNWQAYAPSLTLSDFSQFADLGFLQFAGAAMGGAVAVAIVRALSGRRMGNFFVDLTRMCTRVLLPLAILLTVILVWQGVPDTLAPYLHVTTVTGGHQVVPRGPIASWEAAAHLTTSGGGYTGPNGASPLENPTAASGLMESLAMGLLPVGFFYMFGVMTGRPRQSGVLIGVGAVLFLAVGLLVFLPEAAGNPLVNALGLHGPPFNMAGKELRFGVGGTTLFETAGAAFSTGSFASAPAGVLPLASLTLLGAMFLNLVFGGVGIGLLNMLTMVVLTIFASGLMVGRMPEFLGKKIEAREVSLASLALLVHPLLILGGTAVAVDTAAGAAHHHGPLGFTQILYAFASGAANNGSSMMAGLAAGRPFYEWAIGIEVLVARFVPLIAMLFLAEALLGKQTVPETAGTLHTDTPLFGGVLLGTIVLAAALTYLPIVALGPVAEHYLLWVGHAL